MSNVRAKFPPYPVVSARVAPRKRITFSAQPAHTARSHGTCFAFPWREP